MTNVRASDADRAKIVAALERHTAAGRLTLDEFSDRVEAAYRAVTQSDLAVVTSDLPAEDHREAPRHRELIVAFLIAAITIAVLGVVLTLGR